MLPKIDELIIDEKHKTYLMKKYIFLLTIAIMPLSIKTFGQLTPEQRIQDSVIGWWDNKYFDNHLKPDNTSLQKKKIAIVDKFVEWMKKSYTPVAGLGTYSRYVWKNNSRVLFHVWNVSLRKEWLDSKGHFKPIDEENTPFNIHANIIPASYAVSFLNTPDQYFFTWPPDGYGMAYSKKKDMDPRIHPNVYKYITHINEDVTVFLAPNNKLPFSEVTIGQYLDESLLSLDKNLQKEKEKINEQWSDTKSREKAYAFVQKDDERYRTAIAKWRDKYKNKLKGPAILHDKQPTLINQFYGNMDPFALTDNEKAWKQYFPVFKLDAATIEKCKTDQPQWIAVSFPYETKEDGNQLYEMYTALTQHINYDYIYNYFYDTEKVKGISYKPANEEQLKARLDSYHNKTATAISAPPPTSKLPPNVFFKDDFSTGTEGGEPANWFYKKFGKHSSIATVKNQPGNWIQLGAEQVSPSLLIKPLPENFTLEYDLATDAEFSSRTGGSASLILNTRHSKEDGSENLYDDGTRVVISIQSGNVADYDNNNYRGNIKIDIKASMSEELSYTNELRQFTNKTNSIHVTVKLKGGSLSVLINNKEVAVSSDFKLAYGGSCISCGVPAGTKFNAVFWRNSSNDIENTKTYISNVKISKE